MCADGSEARIEEAVGQCELCGARIDAYGDSVEECCNYAQEVCPECGDAPCTGYC